jgi:hypothetical protein
MTSAASNPNQANQPTLQINNAASPPSKRDLKSWWKGFKLPSKHQEPQGMVSSPPTASCATSPGFFIQAGSSQYGTISPLDISVAMRSIAKVKYFWRFLSSLKPVACVMPIFTNPLRTWPAPTSCV